MPSWPGSGHRDCPTSTLRVNGVSVTLYTGATTQRSPESIRVKYFTVTMIKLELSKGYEVFDQREQTLLEASNLKPVGL